MERNAGARQFQTGAQLNAALAQINAAGGSLCPNADPSTGFKPRVPLPLVRDDLRLGDRFSSLDLRVSKVFNVGERFTIEPSLVRPIRTSRPITKPVQGRLHG